MESSQAVNRAKQWQVALFPFNNAATNVYFAFYTYFTYYAIMYLSGSTATALGGAIASAGVVLAISTFNSLSAWGSLPAKIRLRTRTSPRDLKLRHLHSKSR